MQLVPILKSEIVNDASEDKLGQCHEISRYVDSIHILNEKRSSGNYTSSTELPSCTRSHDIGTDTNYNITKDKINRYAEDSIMQRIVPIIFRHVDLYHIRAWYTGLHVNINRMFYFQENQFRATFIHRDQIDQSTKSKIICAWLWLAHHSDHIDFGVCRFLTVAKYAENRPNLAKIGSP